MRGGCLGDHRAGEHRVVLATRPAKRAEQHERDLTAEALRKNGRPVAVVRWNRFWTQTMSVPATACRSCWRLTLLRPTPAMRPSSRAATIAAGWSSKRASTRPSPGRRRLTAALQDAGDGGGVVLGHPHRAGLDPQVGCPDGPRADPALPVGTAQPVPATHRGSAGAAGRHVSADSHPPLPRRHRAAAMRGSWRPGSTTRGGCWNPPTSRSKTWRDGAASAHRPTSAHCSNRTSASRPASTATRCARFGSPACPGQRCPVWVCDVASGRVRSAASSRSAAGFGWCRLGR
jgi:hypothetical protein